MKNDRDEQQACRDQIENGTECDCVAHVLNAGSRAPFGKTSKREGAKSSAAPPDRIHDTRSRASRAGWYYVVKARKNVCIIKSFANPEHGHYAQKRGHVLREADHKNESDS